METLKELKDILDNAPISATHYGSDNCYVKFEHTEFYYFFDGKWRVLHFDTLELMRSLSDINRIVELMEQVEQICNEEDEGVEM